jgi:hypothetical protein
MYLVESAATEKFQCASIKTQFVKSWLKKILPSLPMMPPTPMEAKIFLAYRGKCFVTRSPGYSLRESGAAVNQTKWER